MAAEAETEATEVIAAVAADLVVATPDRAALRADLVAAVLEADLQAASAAEALDHPAEWAAPPEALVEVASVAAVLAVARRAEKATEAAASAQ